ncbi:SOS response-associated peptidase [Acaryochloris marina]|uniref:SOS response-associated peptidase n=1 Tax=Acaryochloris marina TaxID=155978 RepID=UPI001BAF5CD1|nr:SOS response-associated peptidase [Acaryochloris marina]QUY44146.1 SOS response-associated peptidase [Acaryochloris marina S15]
MCGRFALTATPDEIATAFGLQNVPPFPPRYNIAPSQPIAVIRQLQHQPREFRLMQWGLIPGWAKDPSIGNNLINARCETAHEKPSFRSAIKYRRCLIPASGFYEWQKVDKSTKQPYYLRMQQPFAFAGLWESWHDIETCIILTTQPNEVVAPVHQRMPVIISPDNYKVWLDFDIQTPSYLFHLFDPDLVQGLSALPVSTLVNSPTVDRPECIEPML